MTFYPQPKPLPEPKEQKKTSLPKPGPDRKLEAWARGVKHRADYRCEMAGDHHECSSILDAAHVLARGPHPRLRLDPENGVALCRNAHELYDRKRWFKPYFRRFFDAKYPGRFERLRQKAIGDGNA